LEGIDASTVETTGDDPPKLHCLRCDVGLPAGERIALHSGPTWELLTHQQQLWMYVCPCCRHVEFFDAAQ
jgi:hypothetical protein